LIMNTEQAAEDHVTITSNGKKSPSEKAIPKKTSNTRYKYT